MATNNQVLIDRELLERLLYLIDNYVTHKTAEEEELRTLLQSPAPEGGEVQLIAKEMDRLGYGYHESHAESIWLTIAQHRAIVAGLAGKVPSVQITGHLDEIDAPTWEFINSEARKLGPQTGSIDTYNFSRPNGSQPNGGVTALWNGNKLHALAVTVRDARNRIVCVRLLVAPMPPSPKEGGL